MTEQEVIAVFQQRRARVNLVGLPVAVVGFASVFGAMASADKPNISERTGIALFIVGIILFAIGSVVVMTMRCPLCGQVPSTRGKVILNPDTCPSCSARLK